MYITLLTNYNKENLNIKFIKFASSSLTTKPLTIRLPKIFNHPEIIETLLHNLQEKESIPTVTYRRDKTIKDNI